MRGKIIPAAINIGALLFFAYAAYRIYSGYADEVEADNVLYAWFGFMTANVIHWMRG